MFDQILKLWGKKMNWKYGWLIMYFKRLYKYILHCIITAASVTLLLSDLHILFQLVLCKNHNFMMNSLNSFYLLNKTIAKIFDLK